MSALLQSPNLYRSLRRVSEQEAIITIGRLAAAAADAASGLEALAGVTLRLAGIHGVEISMPGHTTLEWHDSKQAAPRGAATGLIAANGHEWGRLRLLFEPHIKSVECPLRFARLVAQQAALMLNRNLAQSSNAVSKAAITRLLERLDMRKAVGRAAGILAQRKGIPQQTALALILKQARARKRSPLAVARILMLSIETGHLQPISLRRLTPDELTARAASLR